MRMRQNSDPYLPVIWPPISNLSVLCSSQSAQLSQSGFVMIIWLLVIWLSFFFLDFVGPREMSNSFEKAMIEYQNCFPISVHNTPAPRSRWGKLKCPNFSSPPTLIEKKKKKKKKTLALINYMAKGRVKAMQTSRDTAVETRLDKKNP